MHVPMSWLSYACANMMASIGRPVLNHTLFERPIVLEAQ